MNANTCIVTIVFMLVGIVVCNKHHHNTKHHQHTRQHECSGADDDESCTNIAARECSNQFKCKNLEDATMDLCIGDSATVSQCRQITCLHYDGDVTLVRGCKDVKLKPGCTLVQGDHNAKYPKCCPSQVCPA